MAAIVKILQENFCSFTSTILLVSSQQHTTQHKDKDMPRQPLPRKAKSADARLIYSLIKTGSFVDLDEFKRQVPSRQLIKTEKKEKVDKADKDQGNDKNKKEKKTRRPYAMMIVAALRNVKDGSNGTTFASIARYIRSNYEVPDNSFKRYVRVAIKKLVDRGRVEKHKGTYQLKKKSKPKKTSSSSMQVDKKKPTALKHKVVSIKQKVSYLAPRASKTTTSTNTPDSFSISLPLKKPTTSPVSNPYLFIIDYFKRY